MSNNESTQNDDSNSSNKGKYWLIGCGAGCGCLVILIILVLAACVIFMKVSDSISSSDSENATHANKKVTLVKLAGMIKKKLCNVLKLMLNQCTCLKRYL